MQFSFLFFSSKYFFIFHLNFFIGTLEVALSLAPKSQNTLSTFVQTNSLFPYVTRNPEVGSCWGWSTSFVLILLTLNIMNAALCCKMATALGIQVHIQGRRKGVVARCHSSCDWPYRSFPRNASCKSPLKSHWPELSHVIEYYKEGWRASTFLMAFD